MQSLVGTSGWMYKDWTKRFYPKSLPESEKLLYYTQHFPTVEVNSTFYHLPYEKTVRHWYEVTPPDFLFTVKLSRYITHTKRLLPDAETEAAYDAFFDRLRHLKEKLIMVLVQLPPGLKKDMHRLEHLVQQTRVAEQKYHMRFPLAVEFRHASWFDAEVFDAMRTWQVTNVVIDSPRRWPQSTEITSDTIYLRFHGSKWLYRSSYTSRELDKWAHFASQHLHKDMTVLGYFNNDHAAAAVKNALTFSAKLTEQLPEA